MRKRTFGFVYRMHGSPMFSISKVWTKRKHEHWQTAERAHVHTLSPNKQKYLPHISCMQAIYYAKPYAVQLNRQSTIVSIFIGVVETNRPQIITKLQLIRWSSITSFTFTTKKNMKINFKRNETKTVALSFSSPFNFWMDDSKEKKEKYIPRVVHQFSSNRTSFKQIYILYFKFHSLFLLYSDKWRVFSLLKIKIWNVDSRKYNSFHTTCRCSSAAHNEKSIFDRDVLEQKTLKQTKVLKRIRYLLLSWNSSPLKRCSLLLIF